MLVVIAGLPGAGKTTLADAVAPEGVLVLDSDRVRRRWGAWLGGYLLYPLWRPLVHLAHWLAILAVLRRGDPAIIVRPFTTSWLRRAVLRRARVPAHLIATPDEARDGQRRRRRTVSDVGMRRHERAWAASLPRLADEAWATVTLLSRAEAARATRLPCVRDAGGGRAGRRHAGRPRRAGSGGAPAPKRARG